MDRVGIYVFITPWELVRQINGNFFETMYIRQNYEKLGSIWVYEGCSGGGWRGRKRGEGGKESLGKKGQKVATYMGPESKEKELERGRGGIVLY